MTYTACQGDPDQPTWVPRARGGTVCRGRGRTSAQDTDALRPARREGPIGWPASMAEWETVIGLECHVELSTRTKMFCACRNEFGAEPNTLTCPVCLGHPGSLPVPNEEAIASIVKIGLALGSEIAPRSVFHRKNYFYPDMPKNYQISQYDLPDRASAAIWTWSSPTDRRRVSASRGCTWRRTRARPSTAARRAGSTRPSTRLIDYNRAGVPLVECVSRAGHAVARGSGRVPA